MNRAARLKATARDGDAGVSVDEGVEELRARAEAFTVDLNRAYYEALAGLRDEPDLPGVYARHAGLFTRERVASVREAGSAERDPELARRLAFLEEFLASGYEEERGKEADERFLAEEAAAVVHGAGESVPYRGLRVVLRNTADRERRRELERAGLEVTGMLQPYLRESLEAAHAAAAELGGADYVAWRARLSGFDVDGLLQKTARVLAETEAAWLDLLDHYARRELGLRRSELESHDLVWLLRGDRFDADFPAAGMVPTAGRMAGGMGLDVTAEGRIAFDLDARPHKSSRAFCSPIRVPDEVKLVVLPAGGADDYRALMHELGHALHYGYVDPEAPFEFRVLGDNSITEAFAAAFDHCLMLPGWLRDVQGIDRPRDLVLLHWFEELFLLRRYAAKLSYELALHAAGPKPEMAERYADELTSATAIPAPPERFLEDVDPRFYCVSYLQAWMLAASLHRALRERFDVDWYRNPATGPWLRGLFARGQRDTPDELARLLGVEALDFDTLLAWMEAGIEGKEPT